MMPYDPVPSAVCEMPCAMSHGGAEGGPQMCRRHVDDGSKRRKSEKSRGKESTDLTNVGRWPSSYAVKRVKARNRRNPNRCLQRRQESDLKTKLRDSSERTGRRSFTSRC